MVSGKALEHSPSMHSAGGRVEATRQPSINLPANEICSKVFLFRDQPLD